MKVLVACEFSGIVRDAFLAKGFDAISCDLEEETESPGPHYKGDVRDILYDYNWDLIVAHPPCKYLAYSGSQWLYRPTRTETPEERWANLEIACEFFRLFLEHPTCSRVAVENPVPHRHAVERIGRKYDFLIQPWQFGHGETKRTCFWTKGLTPLNPTNIVDGRSNRIHMMGQSKKRQKERSRTYPGIAEAMAEQWGSILGD